MLLEIGGICIIGLGGWTPMIGFQIPARAEIWFEISTSPAPLPTQLWWVHWLYIVSGKIWRWGRGLALLALAHASRWKFLTLAIVSFERHQFWGALGMPRPQLFGWGCEGRVEWSPWNIKSYNVRECEMRTLSRSIDISEIERFVEMGKNSWDDTIILCYVPPCIAI